MSDDGENRLIHGMITCNVRNSAYELVFDAGVDCSRIHFHLFMPPFQVAVSDGQFVEVSSPVPTGFKLPNGAQPFIHNMFENITLKGITAEAPQAADDDDDDDGGGDDDDDDGGDDDDDD